MCIAIPAKIIKNANNEALVSIGSARKKIDTTLVPGAKRGDWVMVHAGFAIQVLDRKDALRIIDIYEELYET